MGQRALSPIKRTGPYIERNIIVHGLICFFPNAIGMVTYLAKNKTKYTKPNFNAMLKFIADHWTRETYKLEFWVQFYIKSIVGVTKLAHSIKYYDTCKCLMFQITPISTWNAQKLNIFTTPNDW